MSSSEENDYFNIFAEDEIFEHSPNTTKHASLGAYLRSTADSYARDQWSEMNNPLFPETRAEYIEKLVNKNLVVHGTHGQQPACYVRNIYDMDLYESLEGYYRLCVTLIADVHKGILRSSWMNTPKCVNDAIVKQMPSDVAMKLDALIWKVH